ncbi:MAG: TetR/AcrR family transcriptional regulator [Planctomycetia bacterium]|nr:TetR/AcrR family transcriptional regulator [Planctomycetia bacterium]
MTRLKLKTPAKLTSEERRADIIRAVRYVFAEKGFDGTTTRELADAAGVSEALLFKHFPNKEALFTAMQHSCCNEQDQGRFERLAALEPSASTLVLMVHFLTSKIITGSGTPADKRQIQNRLMLRSLAEDGEFARLFLTRVSDLWIPKIRECLKGAVAAGDAIDTGALAAGLGGWFAHHVPVMVLINSLPDPPAIDYGTSRKKLVEETVLFCLRGLGLTEQAIRRYYNPQALALIED